jgi:hypothetical protein
MRIKIRHQLKFFQMFDLLRPYPFSGAYTFLHSRSRWSLKITYSYSSNKSSNVGASKKPNNIVSMHAAGRSEGSLQLLHAQPLASKAHGRSSSAVNYANGWAAKRSINILSMPAANRSEGSLQLLHSHPRTSPPPKSRMRFISSTAGLTDRQGFAKPNRVIPMRSANRSEGSLQLLQPLPRSPDESYYYSADPANNQTSRKQSRVISMHTSNRSEGSLQLLQPHPRSPADSYRISSAGPSHMNDLRAAEKPGPIISMHAANKSEGSLQLLRSQPQHPPSLSNRSSITDSLTTDFHKDAVSERETTIATSPLSHPPSAFQARSIKSYTSSPDLLSLASVEAPPPDSRKRRRYGQPNGHEDFQSYTRHEHGEGQHRQSELQEASRLHQLISARAQSRLAFPSSDDVPTESVLDHETDTTSGISSMEPTLLATHRTSVTSSDHNQETRPTLLRPPKVPADLPDVDRSPLFTECERDTVMRFLKRVSANIQGKQTQIPKRLSEKPPSQERDQMSDFSWEAKSVRTGEESEAPKRLDQAPIRDSHWRVRERQISTASSNVSLLLSSLEPSQSPRSGGRVLSEFYNHSPQNGDPDAPVVTRQAGVGSHIRRNKTWTSRQEEQISIAYGSRTQQRRWTRGPGKTSPSMPPPTRPSLLFRATNMNSSVEIDDVYHSILPDLPRSRSLRLASTTSLSAMEEMIHHQRESRAMNQAAMSVSDEDSQSQHGVQFPSLENRGGKMPEPQLSPIEGVPPDASTRTLSTPFLYRQTRTQSFATSKTLLSPTDLATGGVNEHGQSEGGLKSFMDVSPDKGAKKSPGAKPKRGLRKLLAKAGSGVLNWGKNLMGKKSQAA